MDRSAGKPLTFATLPAADRRAFLRGTASAFAALAASSCMVRGGNRVPLAATDGYGPLLPDPDGLLDLPSGFSYRIVSKLGDAMSDGGAVPNRGDGMGCFDLGGGRIALVRNHEMVPGEDGGGRIAKGYDLQDGAVVLPGGTTTIVLDAVTLSVERQYRSLGGTIRNCAGGTTPWGSWLTCEETVSKAGGRLGKDHGFVFEVPANAPGLIDAVPLKEMGRFNHEAACVDPASGIVYLTEDREDGLLYRFIPNVPGKLAQGGKLQALALAAAYKDSRNWGLANAIDVGAWYEARWVDIPRPDSDADDVRLQGAERGATLFARGEGIHMGEGELYFVCTSGGAARLGQIFRLRPGAEGGDRLELFFESVSPDQFNFGDNLTVAPNGHLVVCEDQYTDVVDNHLRGITPDGAAYPLAKLHLQTEFAGACYSPDGKTLFVNAYSPTTTFAITGPWIGAA